MAPELVLLNRFGTPPNSLASWMLADYWSLGITIFELVITIPFIDCYFNEYNRREVESMDELIWVSEHFVSQGQNALQNKLRTMCDLYLPNNRQLGAYVYDTLSSLLQIDAKNRHMI